MLALTKDSSLSDLVLTSLMFAYSRADGNVFDQGEMRSSWMRDKVFENFYMFGELAASLSMALPLHSWWLAYCASTLPRTVPLKMALYVTGKVCPNNTVFTRKSQPSRLTAGYCCPKVKKKKKKKG